MVIVHSYVKLPEGMTWGTIWVGFDQKWLNMPQTQPFCRWSDSSTVLEKASLEVEEEDHRLHQQGLALDSLDFFHPAGSKKTRPRR